MIGIEQAIARIDPVRDDQSPVRGRADGFKTAASPGPSLNAPDQGFDDRVALYLVVVNSHHAFFGRHVRVGQNAFEDAGIALVRPVMFVVGAAFDRARRQAFAIRPA